MLNSWFLSGLAILFVITLLWIVSLIVKNSSIIDIFWGPFFVLIVWVSFSVSQFHPGLRQWIVLTTVSLWGLRLGGYVFWRNHGKGEDFRYAAWRQQYGRTWVWRSFFQVFLLQGVLAWIISWPLVYIVSSPTPAGLTFLDGAGVLAWIIGFCFEAGGDYQLAKFRADSGNKGKILQSGFWKYTRHPNYFGDSFQWWGWYVMALGTGGWWTVFSPAMMTFLLIKISGVALLERTLAEKKPGYREYMEKTSAFFPWFPKS
ncbi:DUF1295 domain-containing protein [Leptolinea tardivitalis]|uniref:Membrane protein n=1 Tax=Leptolinea tardivitalis TaxID=229920 RepID=A0A0P6XMS1_9CHLR|nr:DUF1295 domain-containing protein [Leptolinea tardivitalis]KPL70229.1 membrane protein [Leptolinea tardivitalis]GAP21771.1 predicted membrane protein [Leptolinea tardivitalis]